MANGQKHRDIIRRRLKDIELLNPRGTKPMVEAATDLIRSDIPAKAISILSSNGQWRHDLLTNVDAAIDRLEHLILALACEHEANEVEKSNDG